MATLAYVMEKIKDDLDLYENVNEFIEDEDIRQYINEAIKEAEAEIHNVFEDYFLTYTSLTLTEDSEVVALPTDIYANKIRKIFYYPSIESNRYEVKRLYRLADYLDVDSQDNYRYLINNSASAGNNIELIPASRETSTDLKCFYIRDAKQFDKEGTEDAEEIDIPEFESFIIACAKKLIYEKDSDPRTGDAAQERERLRKLMIGTLTRSVPDSNNEIRIDTTFYDEFNV